MVTIDKLNDPFSESGIKPKNDFEIEDFIPVRMKIDFFLHSKSNLIQYALNEFKEAGWMNEKNKFEEPDENELKNFGMSMQEAMCVHICQLLDLLHKEGHSGGSIGYALNLFERLARFKPLTPIEDKEEQWIEVSDNLWQNKRYSQIFKNNEGKAWDIEGRVFYKINETGEKEYYTNSHSIKYITFPYIVPDKPEYIDEDIYKLEHPDEYIDQDREINMIDSEEITNS